MKLLAVFADPEAARTALERLRLREYEMYSCEPLDQPHVSSGLLKAAVLGGLGGGMGGASLAVWTALAMKLYTGGMPIVAYGPVGIITFAFGALGAIGAILGTLLWQAGLLTLRLRLPEDVRKEVAGGAVAVAVEVEEKQQQVLRESGARIQLL